MASVQRPADPPGEDDRAHDLVARGQRLGQGVGQSVDGPDAAGDPLHGLRRSGRAPAVDGIVEIAGREQRGVVGDARVRADETSLDDARAASSAHDDDVVGLRRLAELLDDRVDDRIGRHRARQPGQDAGERVGLGPAARIERPGPPRRATGPRRRPRRRPPGGTSRPDSGRRPKARAIATRAIRRKAPEKSHQDRRIRRSDGSTGRAGRRVGWVTSEIEDGGPGPSRPVPRRGTDGGPRWYFRPRRRHPCLDPPCPRRPRRALRRA